MSTSGLICAFIIITIGGSIVDGLRKGLLSIACPVIAFLFALNVAGTGNTILGRLPDNIANPAYDTVKTIANEIIKNYTRKLPGEDNGTVSSEMLTVFNVEDKYIEILNNSINDTDFAIHFRNMFSFVIIYGIVGLVAQLIVNILSKNLLIKHPNRLLGAVAGFFVSILRMWFFMGLITMLAGIIPPIAEMQEVLFQSSLYSYIYLKNPIL